MTEITAKLEDFTLSRQEQPKGTIQKVGVIGCGSMGQQIAKTISQHGFDVVCLDVDDQHVSDAIAGITNLLDDEIRRWGMTNGEKRLILSRIKGTREYRDLSDCDFVVETINSKKPGTSLELRKEIFKHVEEHVSNDTIITSNTAVLMISDLAEGLKHP
ncbi:MAG TPA: 3-hydroxyacyl-CoA dehydrogenase NAD-binding domain-containing protein, partial [Bacteroidales bacterium]|nr:3-hydroxyacyl-CoA dehydrogenase NAD-binding domain-containing protein [Bacteroidales bacterium]